jgi:hydroxymethylglutaryl-CoA reductase
MTTVTSRLAGFHKLPLEERLVKVSKMMKLTDDESASLHGTGLSLTTANQMIENAVGTFGLPLGLGLNMVVNGRDYIVPMAVEEPSVVAAVSFAAKIVREGGGFIAEADDALMYGQVQITGYGDPDQAVRKLHDHREQLLALANSFHPSMVKRGGGAREIEVRVLPAP